MDNLITLMSVCLLCDFGIWLIVRRLTSWNVIMSLFANALTSLHRTHVHCDS